MPAAPAPFDPAPASVGAARRYAAGQLGGPHAQQLRDDVRTVVSELATNAVLHARTPFTVSLRVDDAGVRVEVSDGSPARPRMPRSADQPSTTGRGLRIVAELSTAWGVEVTSDGKTTWCLLTLTADDGTHRVSEAAVPPSGADVHDSAPSPADAATARSADQAEVAA